MNFQNMTLREFLDKTASSSPTPGGGGISAMTGAAAAALLEMVLSLTAGKKGYDSVQEEVTAKKIQIQAIREALLEDIDRDAAAFGSLMEAFRLPKETEEEKLRRTEVMEQGFIQAAVVPLEIGARISALLSLGLWIIKKGNQNAVTDGIIGTLQAHTAVQSAFYNTKINLPYIKNERIRQELTEKMAQIEKECAIKMEEFQRMQEQ